MGVPGGVGVRNNILLVVVLLFDLFSETGCSDAVLSKEDLSSVDATMVDFFLLGHSNVTLVTSGSTFGEQSASLGRFLFLYSRNRSAPVDAIVSSIRGAEKCMYDECVSSYLRFVYTYV